VHGKVADTTDHPISLFGYCRHGIMIDHTVIWATPFTTLLVCINVIGCINEVTVPVCWGWLVQGWVTIFGWICNLVM